MHAEHNESLTKRGISVLCVVCRDATGNENFFGGPNIRIEDFAQLEDQEHAAESDMFVVLSDVWLDLPATFIKLRNVFEGFSQVEVVPSLFVLMGNFSSQPNHIIHTDYNFMKGSSQLPRGLFGHECVCVYFPPLYRYTAVQTQVVLHQLRSLPVPITPKAHT
jgi:hypothetical protein